MPKSKPSNPALQPASSEVWRMRVTETVEATHSPDVKAALIIQALIELAIDKLIAEAEDELVTLKGKRGSVYTAHRKELNEKIVYLRSERLHAQPKPSVS